MKKQQETLQQLLKQQARRTQRDGTARKEKKITKVVETLPKLRSDNGSGRTATND